MSLRFVGGERIQRGRGIGGLLRMIKSLFTPVLKSVGKNVVRAATSNTAKSIAKTLGEQAIESGINLATDALRGNNLKERVNNEFASFKNTAADTLETIKRKRRNQEGHGISMSKKVKKNQVKRKKKLKRIIDFLG